MALTEGTTTGQETAEGRPVHRGAILAIILVSYFMIILDNSIIFTGLPAIERTMGFSPTELAWVQDAYTLTFGGALLLGARAGDIVGRRRMFIAGLVVFTFASVLVGASPAGWWMVAARALQGIGSAVLAPSSLSLLTATFEEGPARDRAVALYAAVAGIGASLGLVVGGTMADLLSWRAGFYLNFPIGVAMIAMGVRFIPQMGRGRGRFDVAGALLSTLGMGALVFAIVSSADYGWAAPQAWAPLAAGILLLGLLVLNEARTAQPIMPLGLFRNRVRVGSYTVRMLYMAAMMGFFYFTTQFLQEVLHWSPLQAGAGFLPMSALNFAVAMAAPRLVARFGARLVLLAGVVLTFAGMLWLSQAGAGSEYLMAVAAPMVVIGVGQGLALAPMTGLAITGVAPSEAGAASGVVNTFHQLGSSVGLAVLVAVGSGAAGDAMDPAAVGSRVHSALEAASVILAAAVVLVVALVLPRTRHTR
ncbi:EmrB/QacA subfamily drug resistance transporter [Sinomonas atrocyanea]|uniref:MFS transporter n=1 Tax=Sinomonas atrocyanea TaxID=37927 RepID=UPI0027832297|nr:MFS transporter [Sinomonas atrocyanea]MDP9886104.1 EmrB/QacA subfamily drug resistance transporter [Sinomonas atrocyanea]